MLNLFGVGNVSPLDAGEERIMSDRKRILEYVHTVGRVRLILNKDLLAYGSRSLVDKTLGELCRAGVLVRIARGVYRHASSSAPWPRVEEVVAEKSRVFQRSTLRFELSGLDETEKLLFYTDSASTCFKIENSTVKLIHRSPKQLRASRRSNSP